MTDDHPDPDCDETRGSLPEKVEQVEPDEPDWRSDTEMDVLFVRRYDTDDILVGHQQFVLVRDESTDDTEYIVSSVARQPEPRMTDQKT